MLSLINDNECKLETLTPLPKASPGSIKISIGQPLHWRLVGSANNERENASWQILLDFRFINCFNYKLWQGKLVVRLRVEWYFKIVSNCFRLIELKRFLVSAE